MDFIKTLENNSILVVPNNIKNKILDYIEENKLLINIKILTFRELKIGLLYDYTNESIYHIMNKFNVSYDVSKDYINNTYYLIDTKYTEKKLQNILNVKNELISSNLLVIDKLFTSLLKSKTKMYIYGFSQINKFNKYLLDLASKYIEIEKINKEQHEYKHEVFELKTMEDEIVYVAEEISKLIDNNIPLNKIFIANYSSDYYFTIKKIFSLYNIPIYLKGETTLSDTSIGKYFIDNLSNNINVLLNNIKKEFDIDNNIINSNVFNKLFNLVNSYFWTTDYVSIKDLIKEEMKNISIPSNHYENEILTTNIIDNIFYDDEYVFLIGFNSGSIPKVYKDEDYINDSIKTKIMETTIEKNISSKKTYINEINNIKNLTITYKKVSLTDSFMKSPLIDGSFLKEEKKKITISSYSESYNKLLYSKKLDELIKFNEKDEDLKTLHKTYDIPYKTYTNKYETIDKDKIRNALTRNFSYSNISTYYKCPFKFYLTNFYKLDKFEVTIDTFIGSLFHRVLEECINDDTKDIDTVFDTFVKENKNKKGFIFGDKEKFYVERLRDEVHFVVDNIKKQYTYSEHNPKNEWHEDSVEFTTDDLDLKTKIKTKLVGIVDKCLVIDNNIVVIDYKTGSSDKIDKSLIEFGLDIQLPIYLYLLKNKNKNYNIVGMYLQHILKGLIYKSEAGKSDVEKVRFNRLKLDGLTLDDKSLIKLFDSSYDNSDVITSLGITKKTGDWSTNAKKRLLTYDDQEKLYKKIETLIEDCINNVADANFDIKPIYIKNKADGCNFCKYKDICYKRESDTNIIVLESNEEGDDSE